MRSIVSFYICYLLCLCLGLACLACVLLWNNRWRGGFAWDGSPAQFNWHPVLMVTGLVVLYGYGEVYSLQSFISLSHFCFLLQKDSDCIKVMTHYGFLETYPVI